MRDYLLNAAVRLRRNYADLPFDAEVNKETAEKVNARALEALEGAEDTYAYFMLNDLPGEKKRVLRQNRLLCEDVTDAVASRVYMWLDQRVCVQTSGSDHLAVAAYSDQGDILSCLSLCQRAEEPLYKDGNIAKDARFGYLTARPCDAGTGMRASMLLHLPMTSLVKQTPNAMKVSAANGMILRGAESGPAGHHAGLYMLENRITLGMEENEIVQKMRDTAQKLMELEDKLRQKAKDQKDEMVYDAAWRSYALARYARKVTRAEALQLWSGITLGMSLGLNLCEDENMEKLWQLSHESQLKLQQTATQQQLHIDVLRARRIRDIVNGGT